MYSGCDRWCFVAGKSSLMSVIGNRELPIPTHIDIYHLSHEAAPTPQTALDCVMEVDSVRVQLEREAEELALSHSDGQHSVMLQLILIITLWEIIELVFFYTNFPS